MKKVPDPLIKQFNTLLVKNNIPQRNHTYYLKWLRYYMDFCHKYGFKDTDPQSLPDFLYPIKCGWSRLVEIMQASSGIFALTSFLKVR